MFQLIALISKSLKEKENNNIQTNFNKQVLQTKEPLTQTLEKNFSIIKSASGIIYVRKVK